MIAVDTSSMIAFLSGREGRDVDLVERGLADRQVCLPPAVLTELLSDPKLAAQVAAVLRRLPLLPVVQGYWERAGELRARVSASGRRTPLADALIAQSCLDHDMALVTRDTDFRRFAQSGALTIL